MSQVWRAGAWLALSGAAACLGEVTLERAPPLDAGATTGLAPLEAPCVPGETRCRESTLERCFPSGSALPPRWGRAEDCASSALCDGADGVCIEPACEAREARCEGAARAICRADRTGFEALAECEGVAYCSPDAARCAALGAEAPCCTSGPCEAGELRCNGVALERCRADQAGHDELAVCETVALCEAGREACAAQLGACSCAPPACAAGEARCSGATLERCNTDQTGFEPVEVCASAALCELGRARSPLSCQPPACAALSHACSAGGVLAACTADQTGLDVVQACPGGPAFCNAGQGRCTETPCEPGDRACDGREVVACRQDQSAFEPAGELCATPELCADDGDGAAGCLRPACAEGDVRCAGSQLQRCNAGRTDFTNAGPPCLREDLCSAARQRCDFCVPRRRECTPDLTASRTCAPDGSSFGPSTPCPLGCIANTGACQPCVPGTFTCRQGLLARCDDGFSFTPLGRGSACAGGAQVACAGDVVQTTPCGEPGCDAARGACNECTATERDCAGVTSFRVCQANGTFGAPEECGAGLVCAGAGQCVCAPGASACAGDELLVCTPEGDDFVPAERCGGSGGNVLRTCEAGELTTDTCGSAELCAAATAGECPACIDGQRTCSVLGVPLDCAGGQLVSLPPCALGLACEGAGQCL